MANASAIKSRFTGVFSSLKGRVPSLRVNSPFASAFRDGLLGGAVIFALIVTWMAIRSGDTAWKLQEHIAFKTAAIEEATEKQPAIVTEEQPGLDSAKNVNALTAAPVEGLFELHEGRQLPITRIQDDLSPFNAYKRPFQAVAGRPMVSIVVVDFGLSDLLSKSILDNMPPDITLALTPYATEPFKWAAAARAYGHEFWMMLPMQTKDYGGLADSGPSTLLLNSSEEENRKRLFSIMSLVSGYAGLISQKDHVFTSDAAVSQPVIKQIFGRGLAFAESNPDVPALGLPLAMQDGYPYAQNNFWLDSDLRPEAIDRALGEFELQATRKGKAIAFVRPYPAVMNKVQDWTKGAAERGIQIAPLSAMVQ